MSKIFVILASIFVIGATLGWIIELFYRRFVTRKQWVNPGLLIGPYLPIYGIGILFLFLLNYYLNFSIAENKIMEIILMFIIAMVFMTLLELVGGLFFLKFYKMRLWDYTDDKFNYKGVICLKYSLFWGISSLIYYYLINPELTSFLEYYSNNIYLSFFIGIVFGFMIVDTWETLKITNKLKQLTKEAQEIIHYEEFKILAVKARESYENRKRFFIIPHKELIPQRFEELLKHKHKN